MTNGQIILKLIKDITGVELEIDEEFSVGCNNLKVTQEGLVYVDGGHLCYVPLHGFIDEIKAIKVKPKFPKENTKYYCIIPIDYNYSRVYNRNFNKYSIYDAINFKIGNFFSSEEEAEQNQEKIVKILNNPERFKECI